MFLEILNTQIGLGRWKVPKNLYRQIWHRKRFLTRDGGTAPQRDWHRRDDCRKKRSLGPPNAGPPVCPRPARLRRCAPGPRKSLAAPQPPSQHARPSERARDPTGLTPSQSAAATSERARGQARAAGAKRSEPDHTTPHQPTHPGSPSPTRPRPFFPSPPRQEGGWEKREKGEAARATPDAGRRPPIRPGRGRSVRGVNLKQHPRAATPSSFDPPPPPPPSPAGLLHSLPLPSPSRALAGVASPSPNLAAR